MTASDGVRRELEHPRRGLLPGGRDPFKVDEEAALDAIDREWGGAYFLGVDGNGRWIGLRRDGKPAVFADGPDGLLAALRADYARDHPEPR